MPSPRTRLSLLVVFLFVFFASAAAARAPEAEPSMYGKFGVVYSKSTCVVSFAIAGAKPRVLFVVPDCHDGELGQLAPLVARESVGGAGLPLTASSGDELHVFSIASARGGKAGDGDDYWLVLVKRRGVWSAKTPFHSDGHETLSVSDTRRAVFTLERSASTTSNGTRWSVSFTGVNRSSIPKIPSAIVSRAQRTYSGRLKAGRRAPALETEHERVVIDEDGKCKLPRNMDEHWRVELDVEVTRWSDGREVVRCAKLRRLTGM